MYDIPLFQQNEKSRRLLGGSLGMLLEDSYDEIV